MNTAQTIKSTPLERINRGDYFVSSFIDTVPNLSFKKWSILVGVKDIHLVLKSYHLIAVLLLFILIQQLRVAQLPDLLIIQTIIQ